MVSYNEFEWLNRIDDEDETDPKFEVIDRSTVRRNSKQYEDNEKGFHIIQTNHPITSLEHPYFEIRLKRNGVHFKYDILLVGLAGLNIKVYHDEYYREANLVVDGVMICYDFKDLIHGESHRLEIDYDAEKKFEKGDVVGFGITSDGFGFMTINGKLIEHTRIEAKDDMYPFICASQTDSEIVANFGRDFFLWDSENVLNLYPKPTSFADHWKMQTGVVKKEQDRSFFEKYHDLEIVSRDDVKIPCHRLVLGLRSQVLQNMIDSQEDGSIKIDGYNELTIKQIIDFMYYDEIDVNQEDAINVELLEMAKEYEIKDFLNLFEKALIKVISLENVIPFWSSGRKALKKSCAEFVSENFNKFKESEQFLAMIKNDRKKATILMMDVVAVKDDFVTKLQLRDLIMHQEE